MKPITHITGLWRNELLDVFQARPTLELILVNEFHYGNFLVNFEGDCGRFGLESSPTHLFILISSQVNLAFNPMEGYAVVHPCLVIFFKNT